VFYGCTSLASITIPGSVTNIGSGTFAACTSLTNVTIPSSVTGIGDWAFEGCTSLASITIPGSVTNIAAHAFIYCTRLTAVLFEGNAPSADRYVFEDCPATVYYLPGTTGWGTTFAGRPTKQGYPPLSYFSMVNVGVQMSQFGFLITGTTNLTFVVDACTDLTHPVWYPLQTNTLTSGPAYFSDPQWAEYPARFYRLRSP